MADASRGSLKQCPLWVHLEGRKIKTCTTSPVQFCVGTFSFFISPNRCSMNEDRVNFFLRVRTSHGVEEGASFHLWKHVRAHHFLYCLRHAFQGLV